MKPFICKLLVVAMVLNGFTLAALADALDNWTSGIVSTNPFGFSSMGLNLTGVAYGNGRYVGVGQYTADDSGVVETSRDGTNWTITTTYEGILDLYDVTFANGTFVASGWDGYSGNNLWTSYDGTNWTFHNSQISNLYRITYGNGLFVAVGDGYFVGGISGQTNKNIYTSPNGTNWTARASGAPVNNVDILNDVAYGAGTFVAVGNAYFHTSSSGLTWTRTASAFPLAGNVSFCNGLFFAPSGPGTNLVSANGTTWSVLTNNTAATFGRIIYTNGLYLALSNSLLGQGAGLGISTAIFTSTNGTNWVQRNLPGPTNTVLAEVVFNNGRVVIVGYQPTLPLWQVIYPAAYISDSLVAAGINPGSPPQVKVSGVQGLSYGIQYSSTLNPLNWQTLTNFTLSNSPSIWVDGTATNSQRFYRAEWLP